MGTEPHSFRKITGSAPKVSSLRSILFNYSKVGLTIQITFAFGVSPST
jgi:hypothetical protein